MKEREPKYPWCTGVPRPTLIANLDAEEAIVFYYTAPVCRRECKTALIKLKGVVSCENQYVNDEKNSYLKTGLMRDLIYIEEGVNTNKYILLFHNELIEVIASGLEEIPGADTLMENISRHLNSDFERD